MTIDKRKAYYLTLDTETGNNIDNPMVFDIGGIVHDKKGNEMERFSFTVTEMFLDRPDLLETDFSRNKLPQYWRDIQNGTRPLRSLYYIRKYIRDLCDKYNIRAIIAYNMPFDYRALSSTIRYMTASKVRFFLPYGVPLWDSWKMAQDTICKQPTYKRFCEQNGYLTKTRRCKTNAETVMRYMLLDDFHEAHTAVEDCEIEKDIFALCMRQHKKMRRAAWVNPHGADNIQRK